MKTMINEVEPFPMRWHYFLMIRAQSIDASINNDKFFKTKFENEKKISSEKGQ